MYTIYSIVFPDDTVYIGSTKDIKNRMAVHKYSMKCDHVPGKKTHLHYKMQDFGFSKCLFFEILYSKSKKESLEMETELINYFGEKCINKSRSAVNQNLGIKRNSEAVKKALSTRAKNMPYFKISEKSGRNIVITNSYDIAAIFTHQSRNTVRRKVKNDAPCRKYNYAYINGGGLSQ